MKRDIYNVFLEWKNSESRRPLLIRGSRQTGKTYIVNLFGKEEFEQFIYLNFERNPEYKDIFKILDPAAIVERIALFTGKRTIAGKTLLFLDEIQECPDAIVSLRYFYEEMPGLHVIGAGSLLEFALNSKNLKMPVGRIQYLHLYPFSFGEFLDALDENELRNYVLDLNNLKDFPEGLHNKLLEYVRKFFILGGMPAVIHEYVQSRDVIKCQRIQRSILDTYIDDFSKYAKEAKHIYLRNVFSSIPGMTGQKFVYTQVDRSARSREIKEALELLETAGILTRVRQTTGAGIPLAAGVYQSFFKTIFLDVGLFHSISGIYTQTIKEANLTAIFKGAVAEQFVGQELIANHSPFYKAELFYWGRNSKNSSAEVDYLIEGNGLVVPIEVKSGAIGHLKSLRLFLDKYQSKFGVKISQEQYKKESEIISIPLYAIEGFLKNLDNATH